jgi:C1A family cysteine protease
MAAKHTTIRKIQRYGWVPDLPDYRDLLYAAPAKTMLNLPTQVDLRPKCPPEVYDQGQLGSCTANAIAGAMEFDLIQKNAKTAFTPSRLFIYYNERVIEGTVDSDSGAQLRDGIKTVAKQGGPPEKLWPYDISKFENKPPASVYKVATKSTIVLYHSLVQNLTQMKGCLAEGYPFVYGFTAYDSFESPAVAKSGVVPMPGPGESVVGGHAVLAVGYNDSERRFIVRNSWGAGWGMKGYFTVPYSYLTDPNLANDFWTVRTVK